MASFMKSDEASRNRLASMTPRDDPAPAPRTGPDPYDGRKSLREACVIRLDRIAPDPDQPRKEFDDESLSRLADSLRTRGQLQPIRVRWSEGQGGYVVVLGERRWRAAKLAGLESVACVVVRGGLTPEELLEDQLVENALREDLKPVEQARAYSGLMTRLGLTQRQLADRLNISQGAVMQAVQLLGLPEAVRDRVDAGALAPSVAYEISKAPAAVQAEIAMQVVAGGLTRAETVEKVKRASRSKPKGRGGKAKVETERTFRSPSGGKVVVSHRKGVTADVLTEVSEVLMAVARAMEDGKFAA